MTRTERVCDPLREQARLTSVLKYRRFVDGAKVSHDPSLSGHVLIIDSRDGKRLIADKAEKANCN